jgi:hypothetical protein
MPFVNTESRANIQAGRTLLRQLKIIYAKLDNEIWQRTTAILLYKSLLCPHASQITRNISHAVRSNQTGLGRFGTVVCSVV